MGDNVYFREKLVEKNLTGLFEEQMPEAILRRAKDMGEVLKNIKKLVAEKKLDEAKKMIPEAYQAIDKAFKRGVIKGNTAARKKSRLSKLIK